MKMKKISFILFILVFVFSILFFQTGSAFAATLDNVQVNVSKNKIAPGEQVTVSIDFGKALGAYTANIAYDNAIFDYVSSESGTHDDNGTRVKLVYYDSTGGTNPRTNATVTFKAKDSIITSNPTNFAITLEGLANSDASETYDDITTPIEKDVLVEPNYVNYTLSLKYDGNIEPNVGKDMTLITESSMGKNYDHVRIIAEVTKKPSDSSTVKLLARNENDVELDLIQNGWGEADGYALGGKDVKQELAIKGEFSEVGNYIVNIKLINRDDSDSVIVQKDFSFTVSKTEVTDKEEQTPSTEENPSTTPENNTTNETPNSLPKTGNTHYILIFSVIGILAGLYFITVKRKN